MPEPTSFPWRVPDDESTALYPGLVVHDGRVSGSITVGRSRMPVWAIPLGAGWDTEDFPALASMAEDDFLAFVHNLLQLRGEFARLLLVMADAERREQPDGAPWWLDPVANARVRAQLTRCLNALGSV